MDGEEIEGCMSKKRAKEIAGMLSSRGLLADWLEFGPDGGRLDMVLMMNTEHEEIECQRHFAHCVFNGTELTDQAPEWLRAAEGV
ncbi:hypothetical protein ACLHZ0_21145 [Aeromonas salmonicida]|uniref:hypothetical protein n=1 Tax=Aeromonas salmonicida TaxID=645 RepID=UPI003D045E59